MYLYTLLFIEYNLVCQTSMSFFFYSLSVHRTFCAGIYYCIGARKNALSKDPILLSTQNATNFYFHYCSKQPLAKSASALYAESAFQCALFMMLFVQLFIGWQSYLFIRTVNSYFSAYRLYQNPLPNLITCDTSKSVPIIL